MLGIGITCHPALRVTAASTGWGLGECDADLLCEEEFGDWKQEFWLLFYEGNLFTFLMLVYFYELKTSNVFWSFCYKTSRIF